MENKHIPVLLNEVLEALDVQSGSKYIDCTLGAGGHSEQILKLCGKVLGIEADLNMLDLSKERLKSYCPTLLKGNFSDIEKLAKDSGFDEVSGVLFDLGISNFHYLTLKRGFSINKPTEELDMRLEPDKTAVKANDLLNLLPLPKLIEMFSFVLPANEARKVAKLIVLKREEKRIETVSDLVEIVHYSQPEVFLAIRMAVNDEMHSIEAGLRGAVRLLKKDGVLVVISFHSGEDQKVTHLMKQFENESLGEIVTKKPVTPSKEELEMNPKSRSALMRVFKKTK